MAPVDLTSLVPEYTGRWVALDPESGEVLAAGETASEVMDSAEGIGKGLPLIIKVLDDYGQFAP